MAEEEEEDNGSTSREEQEEALVALIEHRTYEVNNLRKRIAYYKNQLDEVEKRLKDTESKLARLRGQTNPVQSTTQNLTNSDNNDNNNNNGILAVKTERRSNSPIDRNEHSYKSNNQSKPALVIPAVTPKISRPPAAARASCSARVTPPVSSASVTAGKSDKPRREQQNDQVKDRRTKRKFEQKEHQELIPLLRTSSTVKMVHCQGSNHISSHHKRKVRSIALSPVNDQIFATRSGASLLNSSDSASQNKRWPEDIAWHPEGNRLFSVYTADGGDSQVSITDLNKQGGARVRYLEDKPHFKGIINGIDFMPWEDTCFITGGSDHAVILWREQDGENIWKPRPLHRNLHSSAVMGVAGMQQKQIVLSAGADRRIFGFDVGLGRADFSHQIDSKCMSVLPNPCDFNLFMVQTGTHEKQLRLFDIRLKRTELHAFGWKQESSDSQSALINQAWSPDGLYITSGSTDPVIHIFDIRYNVKRPSQSIRAHQKRVFRALWLQSLPLLISISSDLNIGLHTLQK